MTARGALTVVAVLSGAALVYFVIGWRIGRLLRRNISEPITVCPDFVERDEWDAALAELLGGCQ